jgi:Protein of unknown function (DUF992)
MFNRMRVAATAAAVAVGVFAGVGPASAASGVKVGTLSCNVASGWGFIIGSTRALNCTFVGPHGPEYYTGNVSKFGADIGYTSGGVLVWTVIAPTARLAPGSLAGNYAGATASATVGVGVGANVLIGGSGNTVALQPLSIEGNQGLNVAAGIASITLNYLPR